MIQTVAFYCLIAMFFAFGLNLIRVFKGPTMADRVLAADAIFLGLAGITALYSIYIQTASYIDLVLVFSLLGFIGTVCFSKFLSRGRIIE